MDKKSLAILLVASSFVASSAFANSILSKLITKYGSVTPPIVKTYKTAKQTNSPPYTDFSGTWTRDCPGQPEPGFPTMIIENDANHITFTFNDASNITLNSYTSWIGRGLQGDSYSTEAGTRSEYTSYEWNEDGSALIEKSVDINKGNDTDNSVIMTEISKVSLAMKNGQIHLDSESILFEDTTQIGQPVNSHCVFSKKQ